MMVCTVQYRVVDPVHFRLDPDPANQNFKNRIWILLALTKNQFNHLIFFLKSIGFLQIFECCFNIPEKMEKFTWKCVKTLYLKYFLLVYTT